MSFGELTKHVLTPSGIRDENLHRTPSGWCPPVRSWSIHPMNTYEYYSYIYHKPQNSAAYEATERYLGGPSCWKVETVGTSTHPPTRARHYFWLESITCIVAGAHGEVREDLEYS